MKPRKVDRKSPKISAISARFAVMKTNIDNSGVPARQHLSFPFIGSQVLRRPVTTDSSGNFMYTVNDLGYYTFPHHGISCITWVLGSKSYDVTQSLYVEVLYYSMVEA